jgi:hypothetical protein
LIRSGDPLGSTIVWSIAPPVRLISSTGVASPIGIVTVPRKTPATPVLVNTNPPRPFEKSTGPRSESTDPTCRFSTAILTTFSAGFDVFAVCSKTKLPETSKVSTRTVMPVPVRRTNRPGSSFRRVSLPPGNVNVSSKPCVDVFSSSASLPSKLKDPFENFTGTSNFAPTPWSETTR